MNLNEFLALPDEHSVSAEDVQRLNEALAKAELKDIPPEKYSRVADYLEVATLHGAVDATIQDALLKLLMELKS